MPYTCTAFSVDAQIIEGLSEDTIRLIIVIPSGAKTGWLRKTFS
ncbi:hypothetical protein VV93_v1c31060 [Vibrio vulnificus]|nr:hypothetical protein VV93_v1c31060 [Vibrio vulnificus]